MDEIEVKAEVFKVIRANQDKSSKKIFELIKQHLPDVDDYLIRRALNELFHG